MFFNCPLMVINEVVNRKRINGKGYLDRGVNSNLKKSDYDCL